ncbi:LLM class flavin-dependent oxidoreductase [Streptomyces sp. NPDC057137]|uniref:LLM class flavin-dependent oxidoreductase n=1 Tax=Streptomyces sp. NPDC057137 TaxID=3346030 RepID=UPI003645BA6D
MRDEYTADGIDRHSRGRRLDETLDLSHAWWTQNPVEFHGEFVELTRPIVDVRPAQHGGPPVYLGGWSKRQMERVGRRADGYVGVAGFPEDFQRDLCVGVGGADRAQRCPQVRLERARPL